MPAENSSQYPRPSRRSKNFGDRLLRPDGFDAPVELLEQLLAPADFFENLASLRIHEPRGRERPEPGLIDVPVVDEDRESVFLLCHPRRHVIGIRVVVDRQDRHVGIARVLLVQLLIFGQLLDAPAPPDAPEVDDDDLALEAVERDASPVERLEVEIRERVGAGDALVQDVFLAFITVDFPQLREIGVDTLDAAETLLVQRSERGNSLSPVPKP